MYFKLEIPQNIFSLFLIKSVPCSGQESYLLLDGIEWFTTIMVSNNHSNTWIDITCPLSWEALTLRNGSDGRKEKPTFYNYLQINAETLKCVSVDVANRIWHDHSKNVCILVKWAPISFTIIQGDGKSPSRTFVLFTTYYFATAHSYST